MTSTSGNTIFSASGISKSFPGVQALTNVDFDLKSGEVHALVGENGAGKSTLIRIIGGVETQDSGIMELNGARYIPTGRADAEASGIRMVMQELNLIETLTIAENIFLNQLPARFGFIDYRHLNKNAAFIMRDVGLETVSPDLFVSDLGVGQMQMVEIAAGLSQQCLILALDEPTASLTQTEKELLFKQIEKLKAAQVSIIYISHHIDEIKQIADRVTILRDGEIISTREIDKLESQDIVRMMIGRELKDVQFTRSKMPGTVALRIVSLCADPKIKEVSFEVRENEILGFAGLMGSGRTETMRAIYGADSSYKGEIFLKNDEHSFRFSNPHQAVSKGIALLSEDRAKEGLLLPLSVMANITLTRLKSISFLSLINTTQEKASVEQYIKTLNIRYSSLEQPVAELSGGNQQKVVIGKWLFRDPDIFIFDEPTRGIDVGAKFEIYEIMNHLAELGKAIIIVSSDLKELMAICDRIAVMSAGKIVATFERGTWSKEKIMNAAFSEYLNV
ncbi:sugar ABC transporter ATP-binding protein [candidate division CSSED10-310 bacterium]|uniref:Sugar ABC transporter ATP-binding protein n=1 Tax=candidate division CSSED10-310 bacterium TaxID=2855610 RepID=A0ABV6Z4V3_UNCC1